MKKIILSSIIFLIIFTVDTKAPPVPSVPVPPGYEVYDTRSSILSIIPFANPGAAPGMQPDDWRLLKRSMIEMSAQVMELYPTHEIYFFGRDGEYPYDIAQLMARNDPATLNRLHLINISKGNYNLPEVRQYLQPVVDQLTAGKKVLFFDTGSYGSIFDRIKHDIITDPTLQQRMHFRFIHSMLPSVYPPMQSALRVLNPHGVDEVNAIHSVKAYESLPHSTTKSDRFAQGSDGKWYAITPPDAREFDDLMNKVDPEAAARVRRDIASTMNDPVWQSYAAERQSFWRTTLNVNNTQNPTSVLQYLDSNVPTAEELADFREALRTSGRTVNADYNSLTILMGLKDVNPYDNLRSQRPQIFSDLEKSARDLVNADKILDALDILEILKNSRVQSEYSAFIKGLGEGKYNPALDLALSGIAESESYAFRSTVAKEFFGSDRTDNLLAYRSVIRQLIKSGVADRGTSPDSIFESLAQAMAGSNRAAVFASEIGLIGQSVLSEDAARIRNILSSSWGDGSNTALRQTLENGFALGDINQRKSYFKNLIGGDAIRSNMGDAAINDISTSTGHFRQGASDQIVRMTLTPEQHALLQRTGSLSSVFPNGYPLNTTAATFEKGGITLEVSVPSSLVTQVRGSNGQMTSGIQSDGLDFAFDSRGARIINRTAPTGFSERVLSNPGAFADNPSPRNPGVPTTRVRYAVVPHPALGDLPGNPAINQTLRLIEGTGGTPDVNVSVRAVGSTEKIPAVPGMGEGVVWVEANVPTTELTPEPGVANGYRTSFKSVADNVQRAGIFPNSQDPTSAAETLALQKALLEAGRKAAPGSQGEAFYSEIRGITQEMTWGNPDPNTGARACLNCTEINAKITSAYQRYFQALNNTTPVATTPAIESFTVVSNDGKVSVYNQAFQFPDGSATTTTTMQNASASAAQMRISYLGNQVPSNLKNIVTSVAGTPQVQSVTSLGGDPLGTGLWGAAATEALSNFYSSNPNGNGTVPSTYYAPGSSTFLATGLNPTSYGFDAKPSLVDVSYNRIPGGTAGNTPGFPTAAEFGAQTSRVGASAATVAFAGQMALMVTPSVLMAYTDRRLQGGTISEAALSGGRAFVEHTLTPNALAGMGSLMAEASLLNALGNALDPMGAALSKSFGVAPTPGAVVAGAFNTAVVGAMSIGMTQSYGALYQKDATTYDLGNAAVFADPNWHSDDLMFPNERHIALFSMAVGEVGNDISNAQRGILNGENSTFYNAMVGTAANISTTLSYLNPMNWSLPETDSSAASSAAYANATNIPAVDFNSTVASSWRASADQNGMGGLNVPNSTAFSDPTLKNFQSMATPLLQANDPNFLNSVGGTNFVSKSAKPGKSAEETAKLKRSESVPESAKTVTDSEYTAAKTAFDSIPNKPKVTGVETPGNIPELPPVIITQPVSQNKSLGQSVTFSVVATGTNPTYSWRKDGIPIGGVLSSLTINNVQISNEGGYSVVVTTTKGSVTSNTAELKILPTITRQPDAAGAVITAQAGTPLTLYVEAVGSNLSYQWYFKGVSLGAGAAFASITNPKLFLSNSGAYYCIVTSSLGSVTSNAVTVNVVP